MTSLIGMLRSRFDEGYRRREFMDRCQDFDDPALRARLINAVDNAIATASVDQTDIDVDGDTVHHSVWWSWKRHADTSAQRTVLPHRTDHAIYVDRPGSVDGPWLITLDDGVRFMPGKGFVTPGAFLDWFEEQR